MERIIFMTLEQSREVCLARNYSCVGLELAGELTPIGFVQLAGPHDDQDTLGPALDQRLSYLCLQLSHFELFARTCIWNYLDMCSSVHHSSCACSIMFIYFPMVNFPLL